MLHPPDVRRNARPRSCAGTPRLRASAPGRRWVPGAVPGHGDLGQARLAVHMGLVARALGLAGAELALLLRRLGGGEGGGALEETDSLVQGTLLCRSVGLTSVVVVDDEVASRLDS